MENFDYSGRRLRQSQKPRQPTWRSYFSNAGQLLSESVKIRVQLAVVSRSRTLLKMKTGVELS